MDFKQLRSLATLILLATTITSSWAGLPPTTSKAAGDASPLTTFEYDFPGMAVTHTGTQASFSFAPAPTFGVDSGAANAYVVTPTIPLLAYAAGAGVAFVATNANTGASTINVSGLGVKNLMNPGAGALVKGDILSGQLVEAVYDGTEFQLISPQGQAISANTINSAVKRDNSGNFSAGTITASLTGAATQATTVQTSTNASYFPAFFASSTNGNQPFNLGTGLTFNPSTNTLTTTTFVGALTGHSSLDLPLTGGTMSGDITMATHDVIAPGNIRSTSGTTNYVAMNITDGGLLTLTGNNDNVNKQEANLTFVETSGPEEINVEIPTTGAATAPHLAKFGKIGGTFGITFLKIGGSIVIAAGSSAGSGTTLSVNYDAAETVSTMQTAINNWISANAASLVIGGGNFTFVGGAGTDIFDYQGEVDFSIDNTGNTLAMNNDTHFTEPNGEFIIDALGTGLRHGVYISGNAPSDSLDPTAFPGIVLNSGNGATNLQSYTLISATLDMDTNIGINFGDPVNAQDAATKHYADLKVTTAQVSSNASYFPLMVASSTNGVQTLDLGTGLTFNPSTNTMTTTTFVGALTGHASLDNLKTNNLSDVANATTAFNNISGMTTLGDILYGGASGTRTRLGVGNTGDVLTVVGGVPAWAAPAASSGTSLTWVTYTTGQTLTTESAVKMNCSAQCNLTFPASASNTNRTYYIKNIGDGAVKFVPNGANTFDLETGQTLYKGAGVIISTDGGGDWSAF